MHYTKCLKFLSLLLFPLAALAQPSPDQNDITGLWKGSLYNDTTKLTLRYEIAISERKGKLYGYTHTFFIDNDKEYYGVKKVKIRRQDGKVIVESSELIANNYPVAPAKGVRQLDVLTLDIHDSIMVLSGPFSTNSTKEYRPLTGSIKVQRKNDYRQSALVPHLEELGLSKDLSFVEVKEEPAVVVKAEIPKPEKRETVKEVKKEPVKEVKKEPVAQVPVTPSAPAADVAKRKIETIQSVYYKSDSLVLTLYDNGEVDGDTVSVLMNGNVIIPKQGLSTKAYRKTIYTKDSPDSIQLVMYAETLGSIPPNTGLLVVHDGEDIYEIRFSGDYQKNAAIVFRRKKN
jgi:hypothetical protein